MKHQFMPMFWGDFFANTLNLTAAEIGAYVLLIAHAWEHGGRIPYEDARRIARVDHRHWGRTVRKKLEPFFEVETNLRNGTPCPVSWIHKRVLIELAIADKLINKRKASGMAGAIKRWGKPMASAMIVSWQTQCDCNGKLPKKERKKEDGVNGEASVSSGDNPSKQDKPVEQIPPARSLATALPTGALAPEPPPEQVAEKPSHKATRAELLEKYAKKRNGRAAS